MKRRGLQNNIKNVGGRISIIEEHLRHYERLRNIKSRVKVKPPYSYRKKRGKKPFRKSKSNSQLFLDFEPIRSYTMGKFPKSARSSFSRSSSRVSSRRSSPGSTPRSSRPNSARYRYSPRVSYSSRPYSSRKRSSSPVVGRKSRSRSNSRSRRPQSARASLSRNIPKKKLPELDEEDLTIMDSFIGLLMKFKTNQSEAILDNVRKKVMENKLKNRSSIQL